MYAEIMNDKVIWLMIQLYTVTQLYRHAYESKHDINTN